MRTIQVTRYVTPLREGGSLPAIVEGDDDGLYVLKFRGAGQGPKALIAEWVGGEIGRALGLPVPEIVFAELDPALARTEPDPEIQDLIRASAGLNLALDYLPGAITFDPIAHTIDPALASAIVWFDALITNLDRTARNSNLLMWHGQPWLIDHGAALFFHHNWDGAPERSQAPFALIKDHVLLRQADALAEADARLAVRLDAQALHDIVQAIPASWLQGEPHFATEAAHRQAYLAYFQARLQAPRAFFEEAQRARAAHV